MSIKVSCAGVFPQLGIEVTTPGRKRQDPGYVVDAGGLPRQAAAVDTEVLGRGADRVLRAVAQADVAGLRGAVQCHDHHGQRVGEVQEPCIGGVVRHRVGDVEHGRDGAQGAGNPANTVSVGNGLADPELLRDVEVDERRVLAPHLDGVDDVVAPAHARRAVLGCDDRDLPACSRRQALNRSPGPLEAVGVNIDQADLGVSSDLLLQEVANQRACENEAPGTNNGDLGHGGRRPLSEHPAHSEHLVGDGCSL